jgi:hypothetical protein
MFITILLDIWREKMKFITKKYCVRLAVFSLVCCVCICGTMYAPPPGYAMGSDKIAHMCLSTFGTIVLHKIFGLSPEDASYTMITTGLAKEIYDNNKDENSFDWNDLGADVLGTGLGYLLVK